MMTHLEDDDELPLPTPSPTLRAAGQLQAGGRTAGPGVLLLLWASVDPATKRIWRSGAQADEN